MRLKTELKVIGKGFAALDEDEYEIIVRLKAKLHCLTFPSLFHGLMGTRSKSAGALVHPTSSSSPQMQKLTWLWMVAWLESYNPTTDSATSTLRTCTACLPPWLVYECVFGVQSKSNKQV